MAQIKFDIGEKNLSDVIAKNLQKITEDLNEDIDYIARNVATQYSYQLRFVGMPPATDEGRDIKPSARQSWDDYSKNWNVKKAKAKGRVYYVIYNKGKKAYLTSLLEYGHRTRNGGRTRAFRHIAPIREEARRQFAEEIKELINGSK